MLADLLGREVGGDDGEELVVVAPRQKVYDGTEDVAIGEDFRGLRAEVVDGEHRHGAEATEVEGIVFGSDTDVQRLDLSHPIPAIVVTVAADVGHEVADGHGECGLAIAAAATEHHAELWPGGREPAGSVGDMARGGLVVDEGPMAKLHVGLIGGHDSIDGLLVGPRKPKTLHSSLPPEQDLLEPLDVDFPFLFFLLVHSCFVFRPRSLCEASW